MTLDIEPIIARCKQAAPGPYRTYPINDDEFGSPFVEIGPVFEEDEVDGYERTSPYEETIAQVFCMQYSDDQLSATAEMMAHSWEDLSAMAEEIQRLRYKVETYEVTIQSLMAGT